MGDTYAVVNKLRRNAAGTSPVPPASEDKSIGEAQLYTAVKPRNSTVADFPSIDPSAFVGVQASHSLPGSPVHKAPPNTACENAHLSSSLTGESSSGVASSPSHTNGLGKTLLRNLMPPAFISSGKKGSSLSRTVPVQTYEDVADTPLRTCPNTVGSSTMGFNIRIGKPKGPRDLPAEWSRV
uniref:Uncharacterized protein n=2 Tax=Micrurus lemniscatus lemniscatus TaxID=129467 RepID=A0A2D4I8R9_MICLE